MGQRTNIFSARIRKQWLIIAFLAIIVGSAPVVFGLWYWFSPFYNQFKFSTWIILGIDIFALVSTIFFGTRLLFKPAWRE